MSTTPPMRFSTSDASPGEIPEEHNECEICSNIRQSVSIIKNVLHLLETMKRAKGHERRLLIRATIDILTAATYPTQCCTCYSLM